MTLYFKLGILAVLLFAFGMENLYVYNKGKSSVIKDVVAGVATFQKKQDVKAVEDVKQTTTDTTQLTTLINERDALRKRLAAASVPRSPVATAHNEVDTKAAPSCILAPDVLARLQSSANSTRISEDKLSTH